MQYEAYQIDSEFDNKKEHATVRNNENNGK